MQKVVFPVALCAACSPATHAPEGDAVAYKTQTSAPSPDYRALLKQPAPTAAAAAARPAATALPPDARQVGDAWIARLKARGALLGYGLAGKGPDGPVEMIDTGLTEREFADWARGNGWRVPAHISWSFVPEMRLPPVSDAVRPMIRTWPASSARTGAQHQALYHGKVELREGCFFAGEHGRPTDRLAWFHAEMGLDIDKAGFVILRNRVSGATLARLGEEMNWGGPATAVIDEADERALRKACGPGEILVVGSPQSAERFLVQYPHLRAPQAPPPPPSATAPREP